MAAIADFRRSGLTQPEFCRRRGAAPAHLPQAALRPPQRRSRPGRGRTPAATIPPDLPRFIPVTLGAGPYSPAPAATTSDPLVLILGNRLRIAVAPGFDPETLHRPIEARA